MGRPFSGTAGEVRIYNDRAWVGCVKHPEFGTRWIQRSHYVWWRYKKQRVPHGWVLHHKDEDGMRDVMSNLQLMTKSEHSKHHMTAERIASLLAGMTPKIRAAVGLRARGKPSPNLGNKFTPEQLVRCSKAHIGILHTVETKEKIRRASTGKTHTAESNEKNRLAHLGKKHSEASKALISLHGKGHTPQSVSARAASSERMIERNQARKGERIDNYFSGPRASKQSLESFLTKGPKHVLSSSR